MRQWHRWIGICLSLFLLVIGTTGVAIQVLDLVANKSKPDTVTKSAPVVVVNPEARPKAGLDGGDDRGTPSARHRHDPSAGDGSQTSAAIADNAKAKQPQSALRRWNHWIKDLHSGVLFGPVGIFASILSGLALVFFAVSGMWMYWQMFARRRAAGRPGFFWRR